MPDRTGGAEPVRLRLVRRSPSFAWVAKGLARMAPGREAVSYDAAELSGTPCIMGTRIPAHDIADNHHGSVAHRGASSVRPAASIRRRADQLKGRLSRFGFAPRRGASVHGAPRAGDRTLGIVEGGVDPFEGQHRLGRTSVRILGMQRRSGAGLERRQRRTRRSRGRGKDLPHLGWPPMIPTALHPQNSSTRQRFRRGRFSEAAG